MGFRRLKSGFEQLLDGFDQLPLWPRPRRAAMRAVVSDREDPRWFRRRRSEQDSTVSHLNHNLASGDRIDLAHGAESVSLVVRRHDGLISTAHLTPGEAMTVGADLARQGLFAQDAGEADEI